jgi:hypothetical protein
MRIPGGPVGDVSLYVRMNFMADTLCSSYGAVTDAYVISLSCISMQPISKEWYQTSAAVVAYPGHASDALRQSLACLEACAAGHKRLIQVDTAAHKLDSATFGHSCHLGQPCCSGKLVKSEVARRLMINNHAPASLRCTTLSDTRTMQSCAG